MERRIIVAIVVVALLLGLTLWAIEDLKSNSPEGVGKRFLEAFVDQDYARMSELSTGKFAENIKTWEKDLTSEIKSRGFSARTVDFTTKMMVRRPDFSRIEIIFTTLEEIADQSPTVFRHTDYVDLVLVRGVWKVGDMTEIGLQIVR